MKIRIKNPNYWYKDLVGQEFDVVEKFELLHEGLYYIKGKENETKSSWFEKNDCKIVDEEYLKALEILRINERLDYCNNRLEECKKELKTYQSNEFKEEFAQQKKILTMGALCEIQRMEGNIKLLKGIMGIKGI